MKERTWYKKYQPSTIDGYVFQNEDTKEKVMEYIANGDIPNLLIDGIQGTGKTTLAKIFINEFNIDPSDVKIINASNENGIDKVRDEISSWCMTYPRGKFKVVLFEEADGLSKAAQKALRSVIDESEDTTRFMFTCNYTKDIIDPLQSRFTNIHVDSFDEEQLVLHAANILDKENIEFDAELLIDHVEKHKPDLRKIINSIQAASISGTLKSPDELTTEGEDFIEEWKNVWSRRTSYAEVVKHIGYIDSYNFEKAYEIMYSSDAFEDKTKVIPIIAEHLYKAYTVSNQVINIDACLVRIFNDL